MSIEIVSTADDGTKTVLSDEKETTVEAKAETQTEVADEKSEETTEEVEQTEESEELAAAGEEEETAEEVKPKKKGGFQKKLERKDREIEALRQEMAALQSKQTAPREEVVSDDSDPEPDLDKFDSHAEYTKAISKWVVRQEKREEALSSKKAAVQSEVQQAVSKYETALKELKKTTPDLDDVFEEVAHIRPCPALQEAIITSDMNAQLAYELAKNPEEYERINKLSPLLVAKEIGKLELKLSKAAEDKAAKIEAEKSKTTKAPAPLKTLQGKAVVTVKKDINDPDLPFSEYDRLRRAEEIKHKKALRA